VALRERYRCSIERNGDGQIVSLTVEAIDLEGGERHTTVRGARVSEVVSPLQQLLRERKISGRAWTSREPIDLEQVAGAHVELLLRAVQPLRRGDRAQRVADGVASMSREEASYWHARAQRPGGLPALRILLEGANR
jgi:hypothetical protein